MLLLHARNGTTLFVHILKRRVIFYTLTKFIHSNSNLFLILVKLMIRNCTFAIGGSLDTVEVIGSNEFHLPPYYKDLKLAQKVPGSRVQVLATLDLSNYLLDNSSVITIENELLIIGGQFWYGRYWPQGYEPIKSNLVLRGTKWVNHSVLLQPRSRPISICMPNGIYVFGGKGIASNTLISSEFLANGTSTWQNGPKLPPVATGAAFMNGGHGVAISETEMVLMGGFATTRQEYDEKKGETTQYGYLSKEIWKFNTISEEWHLIGNLKIARFQHNAVYLNGKVIVSGGRTYSEEKLTTVITSSTEIFDPHINDVEPILVGKLNIHRCLHGMGSILKNGTRTIIAFGGFQFRKNDLSSIEEWDPEKKEWTLLKQELFEKRFV